MHSGYSQSHQRVASMPFNHSIPMKKGEVFPASQSQLGGVNDSLYTSAHYKSTAGGNQTLINGTSMGSSPVVGVGNIRASTSIGLRSTLLGGGS